MLFMDRLICQGTELRLICLRGRTWQHRRAIDPLIETLPDFRAQHPGIDVEWTSRSLASFEFQSVEELSRSYDLIILDHPFIGDAARKGYLLCLDSLLAGRDADYIGSSLSTYHYEGAVYAAPVDAACQVAAFRPDLMIQIGGGIAKTWMEVLSLGDAVARKSLKLAFAFAGVHSLMTFFTLIAGMARPCWHSSEEPSSAHAVAHEALRMLCRHTRHARRLMDQATLSRITRLPGAGRQVGRALPARRAQRGAASCETAGSLRCVGGGNTGTPDQRRQALKITDIEVVELR